MRFLVIAVAFVALASCNKPAEQPTNNQAVAAPDVGPHKGVDRSHKGAPAPTATFKNPNGGDISIAKFRGVPVLVNLWATWCAPCVKELPEINQFHDEFASKGWQVLGLAVDAPTPVRGFLEKLPLKFPVALAGLTGTDLSKTLGNAKGGLPFTVAFSAQGEPIWRKLGATHLEELREMARAMKA